MSLMDNRPMSEKELHKEMHRLASLMVHAQGTQVIVYAWQELFMLWKITEELRHAGPTLWTETQKVWNVIQKLRESIRRQVPREIAYNLEGLYEG